MRTPLAWKNLTGNPRRLLLGMAGVAFAAVLMFMQNGFRFALLESPVQIVEVFAGDLIATSTTRYAIAAEQRFPARLLQRAAADPDVLWVEPVLIERVQARIRVAGHPRRSIRVIGIPTRSRALRAPDIRRALPRLVTPGTALVDRRSKSQYGFALEEPTRLARQHVELMNRRLRITGTVRIGTDFAHDGNLLVSQQTLARYFPLRGRGDPRAVVDLGLVRLREGADREMVAGRLSAMAPAQWRVEPRNSLVQSEMQFWNAKTPIGKIFFVGVVMGFGVGVIICYQILYTNIQDTMSELATLKAMGYPGRFFVGLVIRQAAYLAVLGFVPAVMLSAVLFEVLEGLSGLPLRITAARALAIFLLTLAMCVVSGLLALRKLLRADPASLF
jgi:putative ABC transport system permease protein